MIQFLRRFGVFRREYHTTIIQHTTPVQRTLYIKIVVAHLLHRIHQTNCAEGLKLWQWTLIIIIIIVIGIVVEVP